MNDKRDQAIAMLTEHLNHWKRLLSEGVCTKDEGERTILSLAIAIESIQADSTHDLTCETADFIVIPEGATNGDMIKAMWNISDEDIDIGTYSVYVYVPKRIIKGYNNSIVFNRDWWNSPYRKEN